MRKYPKVLVVSHTVFSESGNMGRTMADLLSGIPADNLAQLYFHSEIPTLKVCKRYFRVTDKDVLKSVFTRKSKYHVYTEDDIRENRSTSRTDEGLTARIYQFSRRRTPVIYFARNLMWKLGKWNSDRLEAWIREFGPNVIFFSSGDYSFAYKIVCHIAEEFNIPVVMWCCDDHYISKIKSISPLYRYNRKNLLKWAKRTADLSTSIVAISDKMQQDYSKLFRKNVEVVRISSKENPDRIPCEERTGIVYAGNLGVNRLIPLLEVGKVVKEAGISEYSVIDVYSGERDPNRLAFLTEENGIRFHGAVTQGELGKILGSSKYLLHVEAFDDNSKKRTRYSLSTKIGESLQSGACILAYGPQDISSMEYLSQNGAAVILEKPEEISGILQELNKDKTKYQEYVNRAVKLAQRCHNREINDKIMLNVLSADK